MTRSEGLVCQECQKELLRVIATTPELDHLGTRYQPCYFSGYQTMQDHAASISLVAGLN